MWMSKVDKEMDSPSEQEWPFLLVLLCFGRAGIPSFPASENPSFPAPGIPKSFLVSVPGHGHHQRVSLRVWRNNWLHLQHWPPQAGPQHAGVDPAEAKQHVLWHARGEVSTWAASGSCFGVFLGGREWESFGIPCSGWHFQLCFAWSCCDSGRKGFGHSHPWCPTENREWKNPRMVWIHRNPKINPIPHFSTIPSCSKRYPGHFQGQLRKLLSNPCS